MEKWLSYDDVSLIPTHVSSLYHRAEANTSVKFGPLRLGVPIIAAPMPDVSNSLMADKLFRLGSFGWIHRFQQFAIQMEEYLAANNLTAPPTEKRWWSPIGAAVGLNDPERVERLYSFGARIFCLDTANGASVMVQDALGTLKDKYPDIFIVAGNVASPEAFAALQSWGADAIRVGIAGGSVCETRTETGIYSPMTTAISECYRVGGFEVSPSRYHRALIIADGGIKTPSDMCKALALGADVVMMGGALAGTKESPGEVIKVDGKKYKILRGAASFGVQKKTNGEEPDYVEGTEVLVEYRGSVEKVIDRFAAGLRSSMSYMNSRTLDEYRRNVKIVRV